VEVDRVFSEAGSAMTSPQGYCLHAAGLKR
jgi:hypothetical protein